MLSIEKLRIYKANDDERNRKNYVMIDICELDEVIDSHIEAIKELKRLRTQNEAMLKTIKRADKIIVKARDILQCAPEL